LKSIILIIKDYPFRLIRVQVMNSYFLSFFYNDSLDWKLEKSSRFIWVCDLVTDTNNRSEGYGEKPLSNIHKWTNENKYGRVALSSGLQGTDALRFYANKMGYDKVSYILKTTLK